MEAAGGRGEAQRAHGAGADALESRRVLAPLLIAPAVIFIGAASSGCRSCWAIYLSLTDATGGSLERQLGRLRQLHDRLARPELPARAPQHADLHARLAGDRRGRRGGPLALLVRDFRGKWFIRFLVLLPWAAPVALSTITWLWIFDSLYSVVNWTLEQLHLDNALVWLLDVLHVEESAQAPPQWLGRPNLAMVAIIVVHAWRILPFAVVIFIAGRASIPNEVEDAAKIDGATGLKKLWYVDAAAAAPDRARRGALRDRLHGRRLRGRLHPHAGRPVQLDAGADDVGVPDRDQLRLARRGRRDLALPLPAAHRRHASRCSSSRGGPQVT